MARRLGAQRTYLTDIGHYVEHGEWVKIGEGLQRIGQEGVAEDEKAREESEMVKKGLEMVREANRDAAEGTDERKGRGREQVWIRPAHDGLRLVVGRDGVVQDDAYGC